MGVITIHDDEREKIVTYVSIYDFPEQSNKADKGQMSKFKQYICTKK